jgi:hypothetical protein
MITNYIFLNTNISIDINNEEISLISLKQFIPSIEEGFKKEYETIFISFKTNEILNLSYNLSSLNIEGIWNETWKTDFPHLLYSYIKYVYFHKDIYFIHSCLIEGQLFIGNSGTGKTTLTLEAIKKGFNISSFDKTCLNFNDSKLNYLSGIDIISIRNSINERILQHSNVSFCSKIKKLILFQISENNKIIDIKGISKVHQLYPFFMDIIKNDCIVQNGDLIFSPIYSEKQKSILFNHLKNMKEELIFKSGNIDFLIEKE